MEKLFNLMSSSGSIFRQSTISGTITIDIPILENEILTDKFNTISITGNEMKVSSTIHTIHKTTINL